MAVRRRTGFSDASWRKHELIEEAVRAQGSLFHFTHKRSRMLIIDMHAATGEGVALPQLNLFWDEFSTPTAALAMRMAGYWGNVDVILCEKNKGSRERLAARFPTATLVADHTDIAAHIAPYHTWALVINDPCGIGSHGLETMHTLSRRLRIDWVIAFNEQGFRRVQGLASLSRRDQEARILTDGRRAQVQYAWMQKHQAWAEYLGAPRMLQSYLIRASPAYHYRIFVLAHAVSRNLRMPTWESLL